MPRSSEFEPPTPLEELIETPRRPSGSITATVVLKQRQRAGGYLGEQRGHILGEGDRQAPLGEPGREDLGREIHITDRAVQCPAQLRGDLRRG